MASGVGAKGGQGRCYPVWIEFSKCMQEVKVSGGEETTCKLLGQDYLECLHHKRAATREKIIAEEEKRQQIQQDFRNANVLKTSAH